MPDTAEDPDVVRARLVQRAFSLSGVLPLGSFLIVHAAANASAALGDAAFVRVDRWFARIPLLLPLEVLFIFAPLGFHALFGLWLVATRKPMRFAGASPYSPHVRMAMRVTGVLAAAFLVMHLREVRFRSPLVQLHGGELLTILGMDLSATFHGLPLRGVVYLVASGCVVFHFAAGLWGFFATSQAGRGDHRLRARAAAAWVAGGFGALLWLVFTNTVVLHATGSAPFGKSGAGDVPGALPLPSCPPGEATPPAAPGLGSVQGAQGAQEAGVRVGR